MTSEPFTANKQKMRELDLQLIMKYFEASKGSLHYFGLPGESIRDILFWNEYFASFVAVERGEPGEEVILQHNLLLSAFKHGIANQLHLLRGDLDTILQLSRDTYNNSVPYPFDVINLDYCGGVIYKDGAERAIRADSIAEMIRNQSLRNHNFLLFLTCNLDNDDHGEIQKVLIDTQQDLKKVGTDVGKTIQAYLRHPRQEARLKVYVPYLVWNLATATYRCETFKPICYLGNKNTHMMHFSFWMERSVKYTAGRPNRQSFVHLLNLPVFECIDGQLEETNFAIPKVELS